MSVEGKAMNVIFISPQFPDNYWNWCDRLRENGATVLGIGDTPYDYLANEVKWSLDEYYWVPNLEDYDEVFRAVAFFSFKYGKIDWLESQNEYWLSQDARLRDDFHITTGAGSAQMEQWQSKAEMKPLYAAAGVPTARQVRLSNPDVVRTFAKEVGFPLFAKPERGVGAGGTIKVNDAASLEALLASMPDEPYVLEEFVTGTICTYEAVIDGEGNPLFENQTVCPDDIAATVENMLDVWFYTCPTVDPALAKLARATVKSFGIKRRFVHMEFFRLTEAKPGLGNVGDYVGLEVNVRAPGGYNPDMINFAHSFDVYQIWADMVTTGSTTHAEGGETFYCVFAAQRDCYSYTHSVDDILMRYGSVICKYGRMPNALSDDMGNTFFMARLKTLEEVERFAEFVHHRLWS